MLAKVKTDERDRVIVSDREWSNAHRNGWPQELMHDPVWASVHRAGMTLIGMARMAALGAGAWWGGRKLIEFDGSPPALIAWGAAYAIACLVAGGYFLHLLVEDVTGRTTYAHLLQRHYDQEIKPGLADGNAEFDELLDNGEFPESIPGLLAFQRYCSSRAQAAYEAREFADKKHYERLSARCLDKIRELDRQEIEARTS